MHVIALATETDFEGWRDAARALALNDISPNDVTWTVASRDDGLFAASTLPELDPRHSFSVPAAFVELAHVAILNRDPERFALLDGERDVIQRQDTASQGFNLILLPNAGEGIRFVPDLRPPAFKIARERACANHSQVVLF